MQNIFQQAKDAFKDVFMIKSSNRNKKLKHGNLNISDLSKQTYNSSSDEDSVQESNLVDAQTSTNQEQFSQTGEYLNTWRDKSEINSDLDKSSDHTVEADDENEDDIEVEHTNAEFKRLW